MQRESPQRALVSVFVVALVCSILVSVSAISLRPIQQRNELIERSRHVVALTGLVEADSTLSDDEMLEVVRHLDLRVVDVDRGEFADEIDPDDFNAREAANDPERSTAIAGADDLANIGRRARHALVYLVWGDDNTLKRVILPIHGQGMWSTLFGFIALESDLNTIGAVTFYEQAETAGLGDQIQQPDWQASWRGRQLRNDAGDLRFRIAGGVVEPGSPAARFEVDGLTGATVTAASVTNLVRFWFGPHGFGPFLDALARTPPSRNTDTKTDQDAST